MFRQFLLQISDLEEKVKYLTNTVNQLNTHIQMKNEVIVCQETQIHQLESLINDSNNSVIDDISARHHHHHHSQNDQKHAENEENEIKIDENVGGDDDEQKCHQ